MIIKEMNKLQSPCEPVSSVEEGEEIGALLLKELSKNKKGIGLAANQVEFDGQVFVMGDKEDNATICINPQILQHPLLLFLIQKMHFLLLYLLLELKNLTN